MNRKPFLDERGFALVTALVLSAVGMLITITLLLMVNTGTWFSGSQARYQQKLSSAYGGIRFFAREIMERCLQGTTLTTLLSSDDTYDPQNSGALKVSAATTSSKFKTKLETTGTVKDGYDEDATISTNDTVDLTMTLSFPSTPDLNVESGILSTSLGNSSANSTTNNLQGGGVVNSTSNTITPQQIPYIYEIDTRTTNSVSSNKETAELSSIYIY